MSALIRVVVVDNSPLARRLMMFYLQTAPGLQVVDTPTQIAWRLLLMQQQPGRDKTW
jgi:chemotaxis response regulator CheB